MKKLFVYFENEKVGTLGRDENLISSFSYEESWQKSHQGFPLSLAMPLSQKTFENRVTLSFFENLLPEGHVREGLEKDHHIQGTFEFLDQFGMDCAGAVIVTADPNFKYQPQKNDVVEIKLDQIDSAISKKKSVAEVISRTEPGYLSLAGAQDKFPTIYKNGKFFLPTQGAPTTHIVKTPILRDGIKESVYNEYYCMELARSIGFQIPHCEVLEGEHPLFLIERYDRCTDSKKIVHRIHQQDFCQAQGHTSEFKYEVKGGPSLKNNYELILTHVTVTKRLQSLEGFLNWVCFNLLIGNNDSHSKNISLLLRQNRNELAPFYDLICTDIYPTVKKQFSFKIGDRDDFSRIGLNQFQMLEAQLQIKPGLIVQRMKSIRELVLANKDKVCEQVLERLPQAKIAKRISDLIARRSKGLHQQGL